MIYIVGYQGEGITWDRVRSAAINRAYRALNTHRAGDDSFTFEEVAAMCQERPLADLRNWRFV